MLFNTRLFRVGIASVSLHQGVEVNQMSVEVRSVNTGELNLTAHSYSASAAHTRAVYHNGVKTYDNGQVEFSCRHFAEFHHNYRTDGNNKVILFVLCKAFELVGNKPLFTVGAVVGGDIEVISNLLHLVLQNNEVAVFKACDNIYLAATSK